MHAVVCYVGSIGREFCKIKTSSKNVQPANGARADCPENFRVRRGRRLEARGPLHEVSLVVLTACQTQMSPAGSNLQHVRSKSTASTAWAQMGLGSGALPSAVISRTCTPVSGGRCFGTHVSYSVRLECRGPLTHSADCRSMCEGRGPEGREVGGWTARQAILNRKRWQRRVVLVGALPSPRSPRIRL